MATEQITLEENQPELKKTGFKPTEDFLRDYANNVMFEPSFWDLKMIFGQLDQPETPAKVLQHTEMTVPWATAKLMSYFLQVFLAIHESDNGKIKLPASVLPPLPVQSPDLLENNPTAKALDEHIRKLHATLFGS